MAHEAPHLRVVGPGDGPRPGRPGPAVLLILIYAALFAAALWFLRSKSPLFQKSRSSGQAKPTAASLPSPRPRLLATARPPRPSRDALLAGEALPEPSRAAYFQKLAVERCNCGCERTLSDCLANEPSCTRSPEIAGELWRKAR
jgi:hypothetical protein